MGNYPAVKPYASGLLGPEPTCRYTHGLYEMPQLWLAWDLLLLILLFQPLRSKHCLGHPGSASSLLFGSKTRLRIWPKTPFCLVISETCSPQKHIKTCKNSSLFGRNEYSLTHLIPSAYQFPQPHCAQHRASLQGSLWRCMEAVWR